jgi:hypothetical protein
MTPIGGVALLSVVATMSVRWQGFSQARGSSSRVRSRQTRSQDVALRRAYRPYLQMSLCERPLGQLRLATLGHRGWGEIGEFRIAQPVRARHGWSCRIALVGCPTNATSSRVKRRIAGRISILPPRSSGEKPTSITGGRRAVCRAVRSARAASRGHCASLLRC